MPSIRLLRWKLEGRVFIGVGLAFALMGGFAAVQYRAVRKLLEADSRVAQTEAVLGQIRGAAADLTQMQARSRDYGITGNAEVLADFHRLHSGWREHLRLLRPLLADNPTQLRHLAVLEGLAENSTSLDSRLVDIRSNEGPTSALAFLKQGQPLSLMSGIESVVSTMESEEAKLLALRRASGERTAHFAFTVSADGSLLALTLLVAAAFAVRSDLRSRRLAEERLRAEKDFTEAILDSLHDSIVVHDAQTGITRLNRAARELLAPASSGMSLDQWARLCHSCLTPTTPVSRESLPLLRALEGHAVDSFEMKIVTGVGQIRTVLATARPILNPAGERIGAVEALRDVTEMRDTTERLRETELLYRSVVEAMAEGVVIQEPDGTVRAHNDSAGRILGLAENQLFVGTPFVLDHPAIYEDGSPFPLSEHPANVTLRTGQPQSNILMGLRRGDACTGWILMNSRPVLPGPETPGRTLVVSTFTDVTDLHRITETLRQREGDLNEAQRSARIGSWTREPAGGPVSWSAELYRMTGRDPKLPPPTDDEAFRSFAPGSLPRIQDAWQELAQNKTPYEVDLQLADGKTWVSARGNAETDSAGSVIRWRGTVQDISERKEAENSLALLAVELEDLYNQAPCGYHSLDHAGTFLQINDTELAMLGYRRDELVGVKCLPDICTEWTRQRLPLQFPPLTTISSLDNFEAELIRKDGSVLPVLLQATAVLDSEGRFIFSRHSVIDNTVHRRADVARRRAEATLHASEKRYRRFVERSPAGVTRTSWDGTLLESNEAFANMLGFRSCDDIAGRKIQEFWWEPSGREEMLETLRSEKILLQHEIRFRKCDGQPIWVAVTAAIADEDPVGAAIESFVVDVTGRKAAEARLAAYSAELDDLYNNAPCGYHTVDESGMFLRMNDTELAMLGYRREEVVGRKTIFDIATEETQRIFRMNFPLLVKTGRRDSIHVKFRRKDGAVLPLLVSATVTRDARGEFRSRSTVLDVSAAHKLETARLAAEEALRRNELRLSLALEAAQLGFWELDLTDDTAVRNLRHDQIFGYSSAQPAWGAAIFLNHVLPEDREMVRRQFEVAFTTGNFLAECRIVWPDESLHWVSASGKAFRDMQYQPIRMMGTVADITQRKLSEDALRSSEARYRGVVEDQSELICRFLPNRTLTFMNDSFARYFGFGHQWLGKKWKLPTHPDDLPIFERAVSALSPENPVITLENRVYNAANELRWAQFVNRAIFSPAGRIVEFQSVGRDITDRKLIEIALRESEAAFRTLADAMPQIAWICRPDGTAVYSNQRWADYTGLTPEASYGEAWNSLFHPEDRQLARDAWNRSVETRETYGIKGRLRAASGHYRWFLMRGVPLCGDSGAVIMWFGTCTDIEDLMRAESDLRQLNEQLRHANSYNRSLIEASLDPLVTIGIDGGITDVNQAAERATGYPRAELIGRDFATCFTEPEKVRSGWEEAFRVGLVRDYPLELRHHDGNVISVLYNASVYRDETGQAIGIFAAARDVTARKQAEAELASHRSQLEEIVIALSSSLADKELLLREIHHRVKNNLQIVSSLLHMQARLTTDTAARELLRESENRVQSMGAVHESLYQSSEFSKVDLSKYLRRVVDHVAASYRKSGVTSVVQGDDDIFVTTEIAMPCGLIVNELLSNALKHGFSAGTGKVTVTLRRKASLLQLAVQDNGSGLPASFDLENTTGLGLQLVRTLTAQLHGELNATRAEGTVFEVEFRGA